MGGDVTTPRRSGATSLVGVKCDPSSPTSIRSRRGQRRTVVTFAVLGALGLAVTACSGDDDTESSSTTTTLAAATTTTATPATTTTTTTTPPPTTIDYVTEGATVVVANSSSINGAAGRMSARLEAVGFTMGEATNGSEGVLETTKIYFDPANENAQPVAESLRLALGGGDITLSEMGVPAPVESGDVGDATVVVSMGNDTADKTLEELQGITTPATGSTADGSTETTEASTETTETTEATTETTGG